MVRAASERSHTLAIFQPLLGLQDAVYRLSLSYTDTSFGLPTGPSRGVLPIVNSSTRYYTLRSVTTEPALKDVHTLSSPFLRLQQQTSATKKEEEKRKGEIEIADIGVTWLHDDIWPHASSTFSPKLPLLHDIATPPACSSKFLLSLR